VESTKKAPMGIAEAWDRQRSCEGNSVLWRPILLDCPKTCVSRAISKEVLSRAGLVSCLDYYNERYVLKLCWAAVCRTARTVGVRKERKSPLLD